jgi:fucose permease
MAPPTQSHVSHERRLTWLAYAAMIVLGLNLGWLGPFLPQISRGIGASLDRTGLIFSAISAGYFVALPAAGALGHRRGSHLLLIFAMALDAAGFLGLAAAHATPSILCAAAAIGCAQSGIDVAANALVADLNRNRLAAALNYLHLMWGVGAMLGPAVDGFALANHIGYRATFTAGAAVTAIVAAALWLAPRVKVAAAADKIEDLRSLLARPLVWAIATVLGLYVGAEVGIGAWLYSYLRHADAPLPISLASAGVSVYWAGLIAGRLSGAILARRISPRRLAATSSIVSVAALTILFFAPLSPYFVFPIVALIGLGYGPVFPNMIAVGAESFPTRVATMTSVVAGGAALGGISLPWLMGVALVNGGRNASIGVALATTLVMLAVLAGLDFSAPARAATDSIFNAVK